MKFKDITTNLTSWFIKNPKKTAYLVLLFLLAGNAFVFYLAYTIKKEDLKREMTTILYSVQKNIDHTLKNSHSTALTLALTINDKGEPENFESIASYLLANNPTIDVLQLVPGGVIRYVYPLAGNETVIGYDIMNEQHVKNETQKAITLNSMYFAGPLELKQGGVGVVGRFPVTINNEFWGFSAVIIKLNTLLKNSGINEINSEKYYFQLSKPNPVTGVEEFFLPGDTNFTAKRHESIFFTEGNWKLYLIVKNPNTVLYELLPFFCLSIFCCFLIMLIVKTTLKRPSEIQALVKKQAKKIVRSETKYKTIFNQAAVGIARIDLNTNAYIEVNEQYCNILGYSKEELFDKDFRSITHPDDLQETQEYLQKLKNGEVEKINLEKRYLHKNNFVIWARVTVSVLRADEGAAKSFISVVEDITEKKKAEETIKKSEEQYKSLFNESPIALWEEDLSEVKKYLLKLGLMGREKSYVSEYLEHHPEVIAKCISLIKIINVNNECLILHKASGKEELIQNFTEIITKGSFDALKTIILMLTQYEYKGRVASQIIFPDGSVKELLLLWNVVKEYENTLERVIVFTEDITERKASQNKIIQSQMRLESLINTIDGIVWECDAENFNFTFISKQVERILGYTVEEYLSTPTFWQDHIHPDDRDWAVNYCTTQTMKRNSRHDFEYRMVAKDGKIVWLRDIVNLTIEVDGTVQLRGIMIDITKSKDTEIELNNSLLLVTEQNKRLLNFSYIISHNLRSHTSNLQSISNLIKDADSDQEKNELLLLLHSVSDSLNDTMHNLNEVVNIQTNINLNVEPLNLRAYIDKTLSDLHKEIQQRNITINCHVQKDTIVMYNPAYLQNILINCISNAIRYSDPAKDSYINIDSYIENSKTVLEISDNGIGIDMYKNKDKIFGMYKTFNNNPDAKGMGLFITKSQIDAMGGKITVDSALTEGTSFKIYFK